MVFLSFLVFVFWNLEGVLFAYDHVSMLCDCLCNCCAAVYSRIRFTFQAPVCTCRFEEAPLDVTGCVFRRYFSHYFTRLVSSLKPCPTEPLNRDTIVQKESDFIHSLSLLFITEERQGRVQWLKSRQLMEKKRIYWLQEGVEGKKSKIWMFSFVPFSPLLQSFFSLFKDKKLSSL